MRSEQEIAPARPSLEGRESIVSESVEDKLDAVQELSSTAKHESSCRTRSCGSNPGTASSSTINEQKKDYSHLSKSSLDGEHPQTTEGTNQGKARPTLAPDESTSAFSEAISVEKWRMASLPDAGTPSWEKEFDRQTITREVFVRSLLASRFPQLIGASKLEGIDSFMDLDHSIRDKLDFGTIEHMVLLFNARLDESAMACRSAQQRLQRLSVETRYHMRRYELSISKVKEARRQGKFLEQYLRQRGASIVVPDVKDDKYAFPKAFAYTIGPLKL